ncbi:hypothetical protein C7S14_2881 [Burkholderia cepacia]|nr:hypothetical protein C7S14_2881 [Burkholderia cepacia]
MCSCFGIRGDFVASVFLNGLVAPPPSQARRQEKWIPPR